MLYLAIKTLHAVTVIAWIGGMLAVSLLLTAMRPAAGPFLFPENRLLATVRQWDRRVTTPAMVSAWVLGLSMAMLGHWFAAAWFLAKLAVVLALSALHGIQTVALRRLTIGDTRRKPNSALRFAPHGILSALSVVVALVILKPF